MVLGGLIGLVVAANKADLQWAAFLTVAYFIIGSFYTYKTLQSKFLFRVFAAGYLIRVALAFVLYSLHPPDGHIFRDDLYYMQTGLEILNNWQEGQFLNFDTYRLIAGSRNWGYSFYNALHSVLVSSHLLPMISNAFIGTLIGVVVYQIAYELFERPIARLSSILAVFYPHFIFFSAVNLKDILITFIVALFVLYALRAAQGWTVRNTVKLAAALAVLFTLRFYISIFVLGAAAVYWMVHGRIHLWRKLSLIILLLLAIFTLGSVLPGVEPTINQISKAGGPLELIEQYSERSFAKIEGKEATILGRLSRQSLESIGMTGTRFVLNPSPFNLHDLTWLLLPGIVVWYFLIPYFVTGSLSLLIRKPTTSTLLLGISLGGIALYSLLPTLTNMRHRLPLVPVMLIVSAYGMRYPWRTQFLIAAAIWGLLLFGAAFLRVGILGLE